MHRIGQKTCCSCQKVFTPTGGNQKTCSAACLAKWKHEDFTYYCLHCWREFRPKKTRWYKHDYCGPKCAMKALIHRNEETGALRRIAKNWRTPKPKRKCRKCGKECAQWFMVYCSDECRAYVPKPPRLIICVECGESYLKQGRGPNKLCRNCVHKREVARRYLREALTEYNKEGERFSNEEIFKRDGYRCQKCGKKTRAHFKSGHSLYPTLDHIIPLSRGGLHVRSNVRCLCRSCNSRKGNRLQDEQLLLIGF